MLILGSMKSLHLEWHHFTARHDFIEREGKKLVASAMQLIHQQTNLLLIIDECLLRKQFFDRNHMRRTQGNGIPRPSAFSPPLPPASAKDMYYSDAVRIGRENTNIRPPSWNMNSTGFRPETQVELGNAYQDRNTNNGPQAREPIPWLFSLIFRVPSPVQRSSGPPTADEWVGDL